MKFLGSLIAPFNNKVFASNTSLWGNFLVAIVCRGLKYFRNIYIINLPIYLLNLPDNNKQDYDKSTRIWRGKSAGAGGTD